jgi:hypothetical protein
LLDKCEEGILKYKSKSKSQLLELINAANIKSADEIPADLQSVKHPQNLIIPTTKNTKPTNQHLVNIRLGVFWRRRVKSGI